MSSLTNAALVKPVIATVAKWSESEVTRMIVLLSGERTDRGPGGGGGGTAWTGKGRYGPA